MVMVVLIIVIIIITIMVPTWKTKKGKTSEFMNAGGYNRNERAEDWQLGMVDKEEWRKKNYFKHISI